MPQSSATLPTPLSAVLAEKMVNLQKPLTIICFLFLSVAVLLGTAYECAGQTTDEAIASRIVINEFMANNQATIQNSAGNYSDWIELYNPTDSAVDLGGTFLTDNLTDLRWQFTAETIIESHGHLLLWADNNKRLGTLHTSFKLDKKGGVLALIASDGITVIDTIFYDKQIQDISFGRTYDGGSKWNYLLKPTPGEANTGVSAFLIGYPWQLWVVLLVAVLAVGLAVFRDNLFSRRLQP
jgi:hypothetical protein